MISSSSIRILAFAMLGLAGFVACSSDTESSAGGAGENAKDSGAQATTSSSGGSTSTGSSGSSTQQPAACTPSDDCPAAICECDKASASLGVRAVCEDSNGACDYRGACDRACAGVAISVEHGKQCKTVEDCGLGFDVQCECENGSRFETVPVCVGNACSSAPQHACPEACASDDSVWKCAKASECDVVFCECKDGAFEVSDGTCSGGECVADKRACGSSCGSHGGYVGGTATAEPDAGPGGPKLPGESCTNSTECTSYDCTCNNGTKFNQYSTCLSKKCVDKAATCTHGCQGSGGWDGQ